MFFLTFSFSSYGQIDAKELVVLHSAITTVEMNAIVSPVQGSLVFNSEDKNVYFFDGVNWVINNDVHIPYITNIDMIQVGIGRTRKFFVTGVHFTPLTVLTIPGFGGTINSISVLSPTTIEVNITADGVIATYDFVVSNNGLVNTSWVGNGVSKLNVIDDAGLTQSTASASCKAILDAGLSTGNGAYWINPDGGSTANAFQVYCDMITDGGGWARIEYTLDLTHTNHFGNTPDALRWVPSNFSLSLTDTQINDIRSLATEGKQSYVGSCEGVIHYRYQTANYAYAFGFRYHTGFETADQQQTYPNTNIIVSSDGCHSNGAGMNSTTFDISDIRVPVINVRSHDNGSSSEKFGSVLTSNHAWLR